jgi:SAM-dependent methyltransferase
MKNIPCDKMSHAAELSLVAPGQRWGMAAAVQPIRFDNGEAYELGMGAWSHLAGQIFLDWLAPPPDLCWIDVGCGNGALTELVVQRCAPAEVRGIDPSEAQLAYARLRAGARGASPISPSSGAPARS